MKNFVNNSSAKFSATIPRALFFFTLSFIFRWLSLNQTDFANGWDSYFYLVQIQSWLETGKMHSSEWTIYYPLLLLVDFFSSNHPMAVKILSAFLAASFTLLVFVISNEIQPSKDIASLCAAFTLFSPELTYFAAQWPKNLLGVIILICLLFAIWKKNIKWILFLLILGFFCHRMTAVLGLGISVFHAFQKHLSVKKLIGLFLLLCLPIIGSKIIPGMLGLHDLQRLNDLISFSIQFPINSFFSILGEAKISFVWGIEIWGTFLAAMLAVRLLLVRQTITPKDQIGSLLLLFVILWFPLYHWSISGAAYRLFHVGILLTPLFLVLLLPTITNLLYPKHITLTIIILSAFSWQSYNPSIHDPDYKLYDSVTDKTQNRLKLENRSSELIIAHKALAEFYSYTTRTDAMPWIPDYPVTPGNLWRITVLPYPQLFAYYVREKPLRLTGNYYFMQEELWQHFLKELKAHESAALIAEHLNWQNPNEVRPPFLRKH